jgi:hypothetical protein
VFDVEDLESELEQEERELDSEREHADSKIEDAERDRDREASYLIAEQMSDELRDLAPAIIRAVDTGLGPNWTEKDARLLQEIAEGLSIVVGLWWRDLKEPGLPPYLSPSEELGAWTEADWKSLAEHQDVFREDDDLHDDFVYDYDAGLRLDAYPRTERGRHRFAELFRERRRKQRELMDKLRNPGYRARLGNLKEGLEAKRAGILTTASGADDDVANTVRGEMFEKHVAEVLSAEWQGFECQHLGKHKRTERGIDLLFLGPNGEKIGVQCKQHADTREPSYDEWQSFLGGCTFHKIPEGSRVFVTTGTLTVRQIKEAKELGVVVFYKDELAQMAQEHSIEPWRQP